MEAHPLCIKGFPLQYIPGRRAYQEEPAGDCKHSHVYRLFFFFFHNPLYSPRIPDDFRSVSACVLACVCVCTCALVQYVYSDAKSTSSVSLISSFLA